MFVWWAQPVPDGSFPCTQNQLQADNTAQKEREELGWALAVYQGMCTQTSIQLSSNCSALNAQESSTDNLMGYCDAAKFKRIRLFLA